MAKYVIEETKTSKYEKRLFQVLCKLKKLT